MRSSAPKNEFYYSLVRPFLGDGLLLSNGKKWARDRRLLTPAFHFDILTTYHAIYLDAAATLVKLWSAHVHDHPNELLNISPYTGMFTLDVMLRCAMSYESECQLSGSEYTESVVEISDSVMKRALNLFHYPDFIYYRTDAGRKFKRLCDSCHNFCEEIIAKRRKELEAAAAVEEDDDEEESQGKAKRCLDFLDILLTCKDGDGKGLSTEEIRHQVDTFLFEGHDTTSSGLQWTLYYLAKHEEYQQRCRSEVEAAVARHGGELKHETIAELTYLTQCIKEGLRMATPVVYVERVLTEDVKVDGYTLPVGSMVSLDLWSIHHNPDVWDEPFHYNPDRFSPENVRSRHPLAFVPFSAGPRNCIGQTMAMDELKTIIALVLQNFVLSVDDNIPEPVMIDQLVMRAQDGIRLKIAQR